MMIGVCKANDSRRAARAFPIAGAFNAALMCGIAGLIDKSLRLGPARLAQVAKQMADAMVHRGPDDAGVWVSRDGQAALSHRRLSIIDTSDAGHQPMASHDGCKQIVFNGELYNFLELREELKAKGVSFRSRTDTEVLIQILEQHGIAGLNELDAMFAFGWYDEPAKRLILARDIFGEKPLYYVDGPEYFAFASELSALFALPNFDARIDASAIARYLCYQYVPAPETIYRCVRKLPPGSVLTRERDGRLHVRQYYRFATGGRMSGGRRLSDAADELEVLLATSIKRRLISDVPIGAFLSGGVDSSTVVALATKLTKEPVKTFTVGFEDFVDSEHADAAETARFLGTDHHEQLLRPDAVALCGHIGQVLDEPNADSSCLPTYLLSAFTRTKVTVALSGDGGDEMFGGYGRYLATIDEEQRKAHGGGMRWWTPGLAYWSSRILVFPEAELTKLTGSVPVGLRRDLANARRFLETDRRPLINCLREVDASHYMPGAVLAKVDRMSMQSSLEVRAPLIGRGVAEFAQNLAADECLGGGQGKLVLKEVARRHLPEQCTNRPKRGFGLPMGLWGATALLPAARRLLETSDTRLHRWIPAKKLSAYLNEMETDFNAYRVWSLLILEVWLQSHPHVVGETFDATVKRYAFSRTLARVRQQMVRTVTPLRLG
jgi:asparagine synthase (glutamine-hydrolysing)